MSQLHEVMLVVLVIWVGLFAYLWHLDSRVREATRNLRGHLASGANSAEGAPVNAPKAVLEPGPGRQGKG